MKKISKFLTMSSILAISASTAININISQAATPSARKVINSGSINVASFKTGVGLDQQPPGTDAPFVSGSTLEFGASGIIETDGLSTEILAIDVHGFSLDNIQDGTGGAKLGHYVKIGSIVDLGSNGDSLKNAASASPLIIVVTSNNNLILTGKPSTGIGFFSKKLQAPENDYSALKVVLLQAQDSALKIDLANKSTPVTIGAEIAAFTANHCSIDISEGNKVTFTSSIGNNGSTSGGLSNGKTVGKMDIAKDAVATMASASSPDLKELLFSGENSKIILDFSDKSKAHNIKSFIHATTEGHGTIEVAANNNIVFEKGLGVLPGPFSNRLLSNLIIKDNASATLTQELNYFEKDEIVSIGDGSKLILQNKSNLFSKDSTSSTGDIKGSLNGDHGSIYVQNSTSSILHTTIGKVNPIGTLKIENGSLQINEDLASKNINLASGTLAVKTGDNAIINVDKIKSDANSAITLGNGTQLHIKIDSNGGKLTFLSANDLIQFGDDSAMSSAITNGSSIADAGKIVFDGKAIVLEPIGEAGKRVAKTTFSATAADKEINLNNNIYSKDIVIGAGKAIINTDIITDGNFTATNTSFALGQNKLELTKEKVALSGDLKVESELATKEGKMVISSATLDVTAVNKIDVTLKDKNLPLTSGPGTEHVLFDTSNATSGVFDKAKISVVAKENPATDWEIKANSGGSIVAVLKTNHAPQTLQTQIATKTPLTQTHINNIQSITNAVHNHASVGLPQPSQNAITVLKDLDSLTEQAKSNYFNSLSNTVDQVIEQSFVETSNIMGNRLVELSGRDTFVGSNISGISSGDSCHCDDTKYGIWFSPFAAKTEQKARKSASGYKSDSYGGTIGFDTKLTQDNITGVAVGFVENDLKYKNFKQGDKSTVKSTMLSLYSMQKLNDNLFVQGMGTYSFNKIDSKIARAQYKAKAKYDEDAFAVEGLFGYNHKMSNILITPLAGARYTHVKKVKYTETGAGVHNISVKRKASNQLELIAGVRIDPANMQWGRCDVQPEVHGFVNYDVINKNSKISTKLVGLSLAHSNVKPQRTFYSLGGSLSTSHNMMEYGIGYDAHLANKYVGHQATLKLRVNF